MKHWIEFLDKKTHDTKRLGKIANSLLFEKQQKEIELKGLEETINDMETKILDKLKAFYNIEKKMITAIFEAIEKAEKWNSTPTLEIKNPNKKE